MFHFQSTGGADLGFPFAVSSCRECTRLAVGCRFCYTFLLKFQLNLSPLVLVVFVFLANPQPQSGPIRGNLRARNWSSYVTTIDIAGELFGLSTLKLGVDFFRKNTNHFSKAQGFHHLPTPGPLNPDPKAPAPNT